MIRKLNKNDKEIYLKLVTEFYNSNAVLHPIPEKNMIASFNEILRSKQYTECYIFEYDKEPVGYGILAKSFSQEAGGIVLWIEEIYIMDEYRGKGLGKEFFKYVDDNCLEGVKRLRLEVEDDNVQAIKLYKKLGFEKLDYSQMIKEF